MHCLAQLDQLASGLALPVAIADLFFRDRQDGAGAQEPAGDWTKPAYFHIFWRSGLRLDG
jgi:hypothetical protein